MNIFDTLTSEASQHASKLWSTTKGWATEERTLSLVDRITIEGATDIVMVRGEHPRMVVASESPDQLKQVCTKISGNAIRISQESPKGGGFSNHSSSIGQISVGSVNIHIGNLVGGRISSFNNGIVTGNSGRTMIAIVLPILTAVSIAGSADATLLDLDQGRLELSIAGSGDIEVTGFADSLKINISGSGDVDARDLIAQNAEISVAGSGDVVAWVEQSAKVAVAGSGDVKISGNPPHRTENVAGSGSVKFKSDSGQKARMRDRG